MLSKPHCLQVKRSPANSQSTVHMQEVVPFSEMAFSSLMSYEVFLHVMIVVFHGDTFYRIAQTGVSAIIEVSDWNTKTLIWSKRIPYWPF
jgi:hypothetical protein